MYVPAKFRNVVRGLLQAYGSPRIKRSLWNREFAAGRWDCLDQTPGDCVYPVVERYAAQGSILDLGCGSGSTANELRASAYKDYTGIDISDVAIEKARARAESNGRGAKSQFFQSDFFSFEPAGKYQVILFRDSLYYVPFAKMSLVLERYAPFLEDTGVFVVRLYGGKGKKEIAIVQMIEAKFDVVEKCIARNPDAAIIVFRKRASEWQVRLAS